MKEYIFQTYQTTFNGIMFFLLKKINHSKKQVQPNTTVNHASKYLSLTIRMKLNITHQYEND